MLKEQWHWTLEQSPFNSLNELAAHLDIAISTVSHYFRGMGGSVARFKEISTALELEVREEIDAQPSTSTHLPKPQNGSISGFYAYDEAWVGRETLVPELAARVQGSCRVLLITSIAGVGKTALAERLSLELTNFGTSLRENFDNQDQSSDFGSFAARLLEKMGQVVTPSDRNDVQHLLTCLVQALRTESKLIVIDSLEEILQGNEEEGWSEFKDDVFLTFFQQILASDTLQSRLIITS
jgi:hypothetical protein